MAEVRPTPGQTLAVLLGAAIYRYAPKLAHGSAFSNSSQQFQQYLTATMGVPEANIESLFNDRRPASEQLRDIRDFIERRTAELKSAGTPASDLIVHYVGHGLFCGGENDYCLAVSATDGQNEGFTSIRMRDLAGVIRGSAAFLRKFLILDCCFAGAAYAQLQSGPLSVAQVKVREVLDDESPHRGTSLLCSASAKDPSMAPSGLALTMFSDSLLAVLNQGHEALGPQLSFSEIGELVRLRIRDKFKDTGVRPEVHSPDQRAGDVARVPLFPNLGWAERQQSGQEKKVVANAPEADDPPRSPASERTTRTTPDLRAKRSLQQDARDQTQGEKRPPTEKSTDETVTLHTNTVREHVSETQKNRNPKPPQRTRRVWWAVIAVTGAAVVYCILLAIYSLINPVQWHQRKSGTADGLNSITGTPDGQHLWAVGINNTIVRSDDRGSTWQTQKSEISEMLTSIFCTPDGQHLWTVSAEGNIAQSDDKGITWKARVSGTKNILQSITGSSNGRRLWAVGNSGTIVESKNAGASWVAGSGVNPLESVFCTPDGQHVWAVGAGGQILQSDDSGATWHDRQSGTSEWLHSIIGTSDGMHLWAVGSTETILLSEDGGNTWQKRRSGTFESSDLSSIFGTSDGRHLWAVSTNGTILRSDDGGFTWLKQRSGTTETLESVFGTPDGKHVWAVGLHGKILQFDEHNP